MLGDIGTQERRGRVEDGDGEAHPLRLRDGSALRDELRPKLLGVFTECRHLRWKAQRRRRTKTETTRRTRGEPRRRRSARACSARALHTEVHAARSKRAHSARARPAYAAQGPLALVLLLTTSPGGRVGG